MAAIAHFLLFALLGQSSDAVERVGPNVTAPKIRYKVDPDYSPEARDAHVQGTVVVEIVVNEQGKPINISVLSPLGFGLDERAQAAIEQWKFEPGRKDGRPVKVLAIVEVNFRLQGSGFDSKTEHRRTAFNVAVMNLKQQDGKRVERGVKSIQDLAAQKFPPAMYVLGTLHETGDLVNRDPEQALALITKAADKKYGPALYELGTMYWEGKQVTRDTERGLHLMRDAATLGSPQAQYSLGARYETGDGVPRDLDRAGRYFRLCAATSTAICQFHLAKLLLELPDRRERDYVQGIAWLLLAAEKLVPAGQAMEAELPKLTLGQLAAAQKLKIQLVHKQ